MKEYRDGQDFVYDLYHKYGLLEAFRIAKDYLKMQRNTDDKEEQMFCDQMELAMWKLDQI